MGARKGQNNFKPSQEKATESTKRLINSVLGDIRKGTIFTDINSLIVYVAERVDMHRTTLRRNSKYRRLILDYFYSQAGAVTFIIEDEANAAIMRAKYLAEKIRATNLEVEVARLKRVIERNEAGSPSQGTNFLKDMASASSDPTSDLAFANTAMTLLALLERLCEKGLGIIVEPDKMLIVDSTEISDRKVIAGPERTKWFFRLLSTHPLLRNSPIHAASEHRQQ